MDTAESRCWYDEQLKRAVLGSGHQSINQSINHGSLLGGGGVEYKAGGP